MAVGLAFHRPEQADAFVEAYAGGCKARFPRFEVTSHREGPELIRQGA